MENLSFVEKIAGISAKTWASNPLLKPLRCRFERFWMCYRTSLIKHRLKNCGRNVGIQLPVEFSQPDQIEVGDDVSFAAFVHIWGSGSLRIGNRVMIGSHSAISSVTHDHSSPVMFQTVIRRPVEICDDVWLGAHVVVMPGVTIGCGAVVGAGAVVTKNVAPGEIVAGIPAKILKLRQVAKTAK
jgi:maltose O-acetyltransferase